MEDLANRFSYHQPTNETIVAMHSFIRARHESLARDLKRDLPESRELALAITKLEESMFWANAAVARILNYRE